MEVVSRGVIAAPANLWQWVGERETEGNIRAEQSKRNGLRVTEKNKEGRRKENRARQRADEWRSRQRQKDKETEKIKTDGETGGHTSAGTNMDREQREPAHPVRPPDLGTEPVDSVQGRHINRPHLLQSRLRICTPDTFCWMIHTCVSSERLCQQNAFVLAAQQAYLAL